jgi:hypothetical protein
MMVTTRLALAPRMDDPRRNCGAKRWPKSQDVHDEREAENEGMVVWGLRPFSEPSGKPVQIV